MCLCNAGGRMGAPGRWCPVVEAWPALVHPQLNASSAEHLLVTCCSHSEAGKSRTHFFLLPFPSPKQFLHSTSIICKPCCKRPAFIFPFIYFFGKEKNKKVDDSVRLKSCVIQQMNFLFCLLSFLIYGVQLNIIEAGSWFAVWAI